MFDAIYDMTFYILSRKNVVSTSSSIYMINVMSWNLTYKKVASV